MDPRAARLVTLVAGLVVAGSALLPWATSGLFAVTGVQRADGVLVIGVGLAITVLVGISWERGPSRELRWIVTAVGAVALVVFGLIYWTIDTETNASVGTGVWLGGGAAFVAIIAASYMEGRAKAPAPHRDPDALALLDNLVELRDKGAISDEEYQAKKSELLERL